MLRPDGVLWLNYGDKFTGGGNGGGGKQDTNRGSLGAITGRGKGIPSGNLLGLPWRVALALQADGWWLRSDVIWAKALSFCEKYSGSTMPESVNGWRWERCRVKMCESQRAKGIYNELAYEHPQGAMSGGGTNGSAQWSDCPGCAKCEPNGGYVLRKGSWRCTKAHEYLFMLTRSERYYCDMEAVKEEGCGTAWHPTAGWREGNIDNSMKPREYGNDNEQSGRNLRDVWVINPQAYKGSHYATFPEKLVEPCIKVSTSQKGCCPKCGAPWARVVERTMEVNRSDTYAGKHQDQNPQSGQKRMEMMTKAGREAGLPHDNTTIPTKTLGWRPTCPCNAGDPVPALVLDPFIGSGTVGMVAARLGRNYTGVEINAKYIHEQTQWRVAEGETGIDQQEARQGQQALFER